MTHTNDNDSKQLAFPYQINDDLEAPMTDDELAMDLRLRIARSLNKVGCGEDVMDDKLIAWINRVNALLMRGGYEPVPVDFRKFGIIKDSIPCLVNLTNT